MPRPVVRPKVIRHQFPVMAAPSTGQVVVQMPSVRDEDDTERFLTRYRRRRLLDGEVASLRRQQQEEELSDVERKGAMMDKVMPSGLWEFLATMLKDRSPSSPITLQEIQALFQTFMQQQQRQEADAGMWGFMKAMAERQQQGLTVADMVALAESWQNRAAPEPQASPTQMAVEMFGVFTKLFETMKGLIAPQQPAGPTQTAPTLVNLPSGTPINLSDLDQYFKQQMTMMDHQFNLALKKDEHEERKANLRTFRENVPRGIAAIQEVAASLRQSGGTAGSSAAPQDGQEYRSFTCEECGLEFSLPQHVEEATCPVCAVSKFKALQEAQSNAEKPGQGGRGRREAPGGKNVGGEAPSTLPEGAQRRGLQEGGGAK